MRAETVFQTPFTRLFAATGCRTQAELAALLGITQPSVSEAKKRNTIPSRWLRKLERLHGINSEWILSGMGPQYILPTSRKDLLQKKKQARKRWNKQEALRLLSSKDLAAELLRRIMNA